MDGQMQNGVVVGIVTGLEDEEGIGRVKVKFPHLDDEQSNWARLVTLMAGKNRGTLFRPEPEDEVLVAFEHGDPTRPYILGGLWSKVDTPPPDVDPSSENNRRSIWSRSGHIFRFDDTDGQEKIEIIDKDGSRKVVIDSANQKIQVTCDTGDVEVTAQSGEVTIKAITVKVEATTVEVKAQANMSLEATGSMTIKGATIDINGTGPVTVAGTPIKLN